VWPWLSWNSLCRPSWPQTQQSACLWLPSAGTKGMCHHYLALVLQNTVCFDMYYLSLHSGYSILIFIVTSFFTYRLFRTIFFPCRHILSVCVCVCVCVFPLMISNLTLLCSESMLYMSMFLKFVKVALIVCFLYTYFVC
jgi:hypothetical protein